MAGVGILLSEAENGGLSDQWSRMMAGLSGGTAQPPNDDDDDPEADELAKNIVKHSDESAQRGDGSHYVSGVAPDELHVYVGDVLKGKVPNLEIKYLDNGRVGYWDPAKRALVIEDGHGGTVFTPKNGYEFFKRELN